MTPSLSKPVDCRENAGMQKIVTREIYYWCAQYYLLVNRRCYQRSLMSSSSTADISALDWCYNCSTAGYLFKWLKNAVKKSWQKPIMNSHSGHRQGHVSRTLLFDSIQSDDTCLRLGRSKTLAGMFLARGNGGERSKAVKIHYSDSGNAKDTADVNFEKNSRKRLDLDSCYNKQVS